MNNKLFLGLLIGFVILLVIFIIILLTTEDNNNLIKSIGSSILILFGGSLIGYTTYSNNNKCKYDTNEIKGSGPFDWISEKLFGKKNNTQKEVIINNLDNIAENLDNINNENSNMSKNDFNISLNNKLLNERYIDLLNNAEKSLNLSKDYRALQNNPFNKIDNTIKKVQETKNLIQVQNDLENNKKILNKLSSDKNEIKKEDIDDLEILFNTQSILNIPNTNINKEKEIKDKEIYERIQYMIKEFDSNKTLLFYNIKEYINNIIDDENINKTTLELFKNSILTSDEFKTMQTNIKEQFNYINYIKNKIIEEMEKNKINDKLLINNISIKDLNIKKEIISNFTELENLFNIIIDLNLLYNDSRFKIKINSENNKKILNKLSSDKNEIKKEDIDDLEILFNTQSILNIPNTNINKEKEIKDKEIYERIQYMIKMFDSNKTLLYDKIKEYIKNIIDDKNINKTTLELFKNSILTSDKFKTMQTNIKEQFAYINYIKNKIIEDMENNKINDKVLINNISIKDLNIKKEIISNFTELENLFNIIIDLNLLYNDSRFKIKINSENIEKNLEKNLEKVQLNEIETNKIITNLLQSMVDKVIQNSNISRESKNDLNNLIENKKIEPINKELPKIINNIMKEVDNKIKENTNQIVSDIQDLISFKCALITALFNNINQQSTSVNNKQKMIKKMYNNIINKQINTKDCKFIEDNLTKINNLIDFYNTNKKDDKLNKISIKDGKINIDSTSNSTDIASTPAFESPTKSSTKKSKLSPNAQLFKHSSTPASASISPPASTTSTSASISPPASTTSASASASISPPASTTPASASISPPASTSSSSLGSSLPINLSGLPIIAPALKYKDSEKKDTSFDKYLAKLLLSSIN